MINGLKQEIEVGIMYMKTFGSNLFPILSSDDFINIIEVMISHITSIMELKILNVIFYFYLRDIKKERRIDIINSINRKPAIVVKNEIITLLMVISEIRNNLIIKWSPI